VKTPKVLAKKTLERKKAMSICCSCNGPVENDHDGTCTNTGKLGLHCFDCGFKGHTSHNNENLFRHGAGILGFKCPNCGTTDAWMGDRGDIRGNTVGSVNLLYT